MVLIKDVIKKDDYLHIIIKGVFDKNFDEELVDCFKIIYESVKKFDCYRVLLDAVDLDYKIDYIQRYRIGEMIGNLYKKDLIRIACLRCLDKKDDFTEIVAHNKGAIFKFFNDKKEAIDWLSN